MVRVRVRVVTCGTAGHPVHVLGKLFDVTLSIGGWGVRGVDDNWTMPST